MNRALFAASLGAVALMAFTTRTAHAAEEWGEGQFTLVERFGALSTGARADVGRPGPLRGSGFEARFMMPIGWGAYYRWTTSVTDNGPEVNDQRFDWQHIEIGGGFTRRIVAFGSRSLTGFRAHLHVGGGLLYAQIGTRGACTAKFFVGASCSTVVAQNVDRPANASGTALGAEVRIGAEIGAGPLGVGADVGVGGFRRLTTGGNSVSPPGWYAVPSAQVRFGVSLAF